MKDAETLTNAHANLLAAAKSVRELDRSVQQMSRDELLDPIALAAHLESAREVNGWLDSAIDAVEALNDIRVLSASDLRRRRGFPGELPHRHTR